MSDKNVAVTMVVADKTVADGLWNTDVALDFVNKAKDGKVDAQAWADNPLMVELMANAVTNSPMVTRAARRRNLSR